MVRRDGHERVAYANRLLVWELRTSCDTEVTCSPYRACTGVVKAVRLKRFVRKMLRLALDRHQFIVIVGQFKDTVQRGDARSCW